MSDRRSFGHQIGLIRSFPSALRRLLFIGLALAIPLLLLAEPVAALPEVEQAKLLAADGSAGDEFGNSIAISGDTAVIGSPGDDDVGLQSGSAYVFVRAGGVWTQQAKLLASDGAGGPIVGDEFGTSVAISGDTAVIGSPGDDDVGSQSGSAYVFVRSGGVWTQQAKLLAADGAAFHNFGWSVAIGGDTAVIGANNDFGSAYVFVRSGGVWTQQAKLFAAVGEGFGTSVAIRGDTAVIGSPSAVVEGSQPGSAYVFVRAGAIWTQQAKLLRRWGRGPRARHFRSDQRGYGRDRLPLR